MQRVQDNEGSCDGDKEHEKGAEDHSEKSSEKNHDEDDHVCRRKHDG